MIKLTFSLLICTVIISAADENSTKEPTFGSFFGPCPAPPLNASSSSSVDDIKGKWFTHYVAGSSPWKGFLCHSTEIYKTPEQNALTTTKFEYFTPENPIERNGTIETVDPSVGKFIFNFTAGDHYLPMKTEIIQRYDEGAVLVWNCLDYHEIFHFENLAVLTKYQDPKDKRIDESIFEKINNTLNSIGINKNDIASIDQSNCKINS